MTQIISNTPKWVFVLFFVLLALGISQMRTQIKSRNRALILPIVVSLLYGVFSGAFAGRALRLLKLVKPS